MAGTISRISESERSEILRDNINMVLEALCDGEASLMLKDEIMDSLDSMTPDEVARWAEENPYALESTFLYEDKFALSASGFYDANSKLVIMARTLGIDYRYYLEMDDDLNTNMNRGVMLNIEKAAKRRLNNIETLVDFRNRER